MAERDPSDFVQLSFETRQVTERCPGKALD